MMISCGEKCWSINQKLLPIQEYRTQFLTGVSTENQFYLRISQRIHLFAILGHFFLTIVTCLIELTKESKYLLLYLLICLNH